MPPGRVRRRRKREACESRVRVRPCERKPHTSRRSSPFVRWRSAATVLTFALGHEQLPPYYSFAARPGSRLSISSYLPSSSPPHGSRRPRRVLKTSSRRPSSPSRSAARPLRELRPEECAPRTRTLRRLARQAGSPDHATNERLGPVDPFLFVRPAISPAREIAICRHFLRRERRDSNPRPPA